MTKSFHLTAPQADEFDPYFAGYISRVSGDALYILDEQRTVIRNSLTSIDEPQACILHEPYTWTIKQVVGHLIDVERIFGCRALRFAVRDPQPLPGMDQDLYVERLNYEDVTLIALAEELDGLRQSHVQLFRRVPQETWDYRGIADGQEMSVRAIAYVMAGHVIHHLTIVNQRIRQSSNAV